MIPGDGRDAATLRPGGLHSSNPTLRRKNGERICRHTVDFPDARVISIGGDNNGTIGFGTFRDTFDIGGNVLGDINFAEPLAVGDELIVAHSLQSTGSITLPNAGLQDQVIFNDANSGANWAGTVSVGANALNVPNYTTTAETLGGGSVGLAAFRLHDESCNPPNNVPAMIGIGKLNQVKLRHYGPITFAGDTPLTIQRRAACTNDTFVTLPLAEFQLTVDPADDRSVLVTPVLGSDHFELDFEYRIQPAADLVSGGVVGTPAVAWDEPYAVIVRQQCVADLVENGDVNTSDFLALLQNWGTAGPGDIDCNGTVEAPDFLALLAAWGPCPQGAGQVPKTVQDCIDMFGPEPAVLEECICRVAPSECPQ